MALIEKKIRLDVTSAVENYVTQYGAQYDKETGWYCLDPVPAELDEFINILDRIKKQPAEKNIQCPRCGGQMHLISKRDGGIFWSCMSFPRCKGARNVDEADERGFKKVLSAKPGKDENFVEKASQQYRELLELALRELGHQKVFDNWLATPKVALEGKRPMEVLNTDEGYNKVMDLLRKINS